MGIVGAFCSTLCLCLTTWCMVIFLHSDTWPHCPSLLLLSPPPSLLSSREETSRRLWTWLKEERKKKGRVQRHTRQSEASLTHTQACVFLEVALCAHFTVPVCEQVGLWWDSEQCRTSSDSRLAVGGGAPHASFPSSCPSSTLLPSPAKQPYTYLPTVSTHSYRPIPNNGSWMIPWGSKIRLLC